MRAARSKTNYF